MIEVNLLALIGVVAMLIGHTVAIVGAYYKFGGRINSVENKQIAFDKKCTEIEKVLMPLRLQEFKESSKKDAEIRRLECSKMMAESLDELRNEMREMKTIMHEHLLIHNEREKR